VSGSLGWGCERAEPPGGPDTGGRIRVESGFPTSERSLGQVEDVPGSAQGQPFLLGGPDDNLPFAATGEKLASTAWRTWIYTDTGPARTRLGYLRAGAVVDLRGPPIENEGCRGGWYRINPRGFVCLGKGATTELDNPVIVASTRRPTRGAGFPYVYATTGEREPFLYFKLPSAQQMHEVEGEYQGSAARFLLGARNNPNMEWLELDSEPPPFLAGGAPLTKPYGAETGLRREVHAGQAEKDSGFALTRTFEWEKRAFGLTTDLDIIPLDRVQPVKPSEFRGIVLGPDEQLPVLRVVAHWVNVYPVDAEGKTGEPRAIPRRSLVKLTGHKQRIGGVVYWETTTKEVIAGVGVEVIEPRNSFPSVATGDRKWIDVSLRSQVLVAYEGRKPVFVTLVSTGAGGLGDPEKVPSTAQGTFMVHSKHVSATMNGDEDKSDSYSLRDVPFVQYFHKGYALHGAYWHDEFGKWRSHGCVNLSGFDSAWLFEWTDPQVPDDWHAVLNKDRGTVVIVRP
jgi:lipoprotein-anchoring transpeptidase ErfK/SrfK